MKTLLILLLISGSCFGQEDSTRQDSIWFKSIELKPYSTPYFNYTSKAVNVFGKPYAGLFNFLDTARAVLGYNESIGIGGSSLCGSVIGNVGIGDNSLKTYTTSNGVTLGYGSRANKNMTGESSVAIGGIALPNYITAGNNNVPFGNAKVIRKKKGKHEKKQPENIAIGYNWHDYNSYNFFKYPY